MECITFGQLRRLQREYKKSELQQIMLRNGCTNEKVRKLSKSDLVTYLALRRLI
jgi:hypothetical protein